MGFIDRLQRLGERATELSEQMSGPPPPLVVRTYRDQREYEQDARRMLYDGYEIQGQSERPGKINIGRTLGKAVMFLPWAVMRPSRQGDPLTVTWVRSNSA